MRFIQLFLIKPLLDPLHFKEGKTGVVSYRLGKNLFVYILFLTSAVLADNRLRLKKANVLENKTISGESVKYISPPTWYSDDWDGYYLSLWTLCHVSHYDR